MKRLSLLAVGLFLVLSLGFGYTHTDAQEPDPTPTPQTRPPLPLDGNWGAAPDLQLAPADPDLKAAVDMGDLAQWSQLTYQSYRDSNWEIYYARGDGANPKRLTHNTRADIHPSLNRGGTRIVFASEIGGQFELYAMNADGTGLARLTNNVADDGNPAWSPDGSRIAFESYRDGQGEIYVMNADGSGQRRLTSNAAQDATPAWSPDGTQIAFTSKRSGDYRIWVMNADGSGQRQLSNQPSSENPAWSPDGRQIAYDADGDGDGWQDLFVINVDGSEPNNIYGLSGTCDIYVNGWSPDSQRIHFTHATWVKQSSKWRLVESVLRYWSYAYPGGFAQTSQMDTASDWQTTDVLAPWARLHALPPYMGGGVTFDWSAGDLGAAGLRSYDTQYRVLPTGDWVDWRQDDFYKPTSFTNTPGYTYQLRVRARDHAHNVGPWSRPFGADTVTLYTWAVSGAARDARGAPLGGVLAQTDPAAFVSLAAGPTGVYTTYVAGEAETYDVSWSGTGYAGLPATALNGAQDARFDVVLTGDDDAVRNGGFEAAPNGLGGWQASGVLLPTAASGARHTGRAGARVGFKPSTAVNVSHSENTTDMPQLAVENDGTTHVIWASGAAYYARKTSDGAWSEPELVSPDVWAVNAPQVAVDGAGVAHVVFRAGLKDASEQGIYYARRTASGTWSGIENVSRSDQFSDEPRLALAPNGTVHVVWVNNKRYPDEYTACHAARAPDGGWSAVRVFSQSTASWSVLRPQLAVDGNSVLHVIWMDRPDSSSPRTLRYARRASDGSWSGPEDLYTMEDARAVKASMIIGAYVPPQIVADQQGRAHVVWSDAGTVYHRQRDVAGAWSAPADLSPGLDGSHARVSLSSNQTLHVVFMSPKGFDALLHHTSKSAGGAWPASPEQVYTLVGTPSEMHLAVDQAEGLHLAGQAWTPGANQVYYGYRASGAVPLPLQSLSADLGSSHAPQIAADGQGEAHVVWKSGGSVYDIYYISPAKVGEIGDSVLSQTMAVPAAMAHPTLSFFYHLSTIAPDSPYGFDVEIAGASARETLLSAATQTDGWEHRWFDLSAWSGQDVTLTFTVRQAPDYGHAWANIDEVSLASIRPALWITKRARPRVARPGAQVVYQIAYGNQGSVAAQGVQIRDTLPVGMTYLGADPAPDQVGPTLVWEVGELAASSGSATILVTGTLPVDAPWFTRFGNVVQIESVTAEADTSDNQAEDGTLIGIETYLPLLTTP